MTEPASTEPEVETLLALALDIGREAGEFTAMRRSNIASLETKSSTTDIVTDVDRASEELIVSRILAQRPDDSIIGEEGSGIVGSSDIEWVIDPIDGTTSFVYGYPGWSVSIAAARRTGSGAETIVGVVVDPTHGHVYSASLGGGARRDVSDGEATDTSEQLHASTLGDLPGALVATGFSYDGTRRAHQAVVLSRMLPHIRDIRRSGSAALDLCLAASGQVDAYFEVGLNRWDLAAGLLIASEAGATTALETNAGAPPFTVAVATGIADEFADLLDRSDARLLRPV